MHCFYRRSFKTRFEICKDEDGELSDIRAMRKHSGEMIISPRQELSGRFLTRVHFISTVDRARDQCTNAEAGLVVGGKDSKEGVHTLVQEEDKHFAGANRLQNKQKQLLFCFNNDAS